MALVLVGSAGSVTTAAAATVTPAFAQATTSGHLLVAVIQAHNFAANLGTISTSSPGWTVLVTSAASHQTQSAVAYKANCGAGESAPTFTCTNAGSMSAELTEWSGAASVSPADQTASGTTAVAATNTAAAGSPDGTAGELVVAALGAYYTSPTTPSTNGHSFNNGTSATSLGNNNASSVNNAYNFAYGITTGNGAADSDTWTAAGGNFGYGSVAFASFKVAALTDTIVMVL